MCVVNCYILFIYLFKKGTHRTCHRQLPLDAWQQKDRGTKYFVPQPLLLIYVLECADFLCRIQKNESRITCVCNAIAVHICALCIIF